MIPSGHPSLRSSDPSKTVRLDPRPAGLLAMLLLLTPSLSWAMAKRPPEEPPVLTVPARPDSLTAEEAKRGPLTLRDCYELALKRSETVAIQEEDIKEAEAEIFIAASEALGEVHFVMDRNLQDIQKGGGDGSSVAGSSTDPDRRTRKFTITQPLFQGFKAWGALTGAGSLRREQKEEWFRARELLFLDVVQAYYGLLREKKNLETAGEIYSLFRERVRELRQREAIGRSRSSEAVSARARMRTLGAEHSRARGTMKVAGHLLEFLTGVEGDEREFNDDPIPEEPREKLTAYLAGVDARSDIEAARQAVKTAWQGVIVAQSSLWPELSLEHNQYERREGFQSNIDWDFLFKIDVPLFQGGEALGSLKKAMSQWKKEKLTSSKVRREAELEIKESYENWRSSLAEARSLEEAVKTARENFLLQRKEYARNLVNNLDVLEALEELYQTQKEAHRAHYEMKQNYWALQVSAGRLGGTTPSLRAPPGVPSRQKGTREPRFP